MTLHVNVYLKNNAFRSGGVADYVVAAANGFMAHGHKVKLLKADNPEPCDLAVVWGVKKKAAMESGERCAVLELGYVEDRRYWTSFGFGGLNGKADFRNKGMPSDRWDFYFSHLMQPWRGHDGDYVLIMGQVPGDASIAGIVDIRAWVRQVGQGLAENKLNPMYRPHPLARDRIFGIGCSTLHGDLIAALRRARWVVTFNSNSAVDAVLAGVPAVTSDRGSMAWDVTGRDPFEPPPMPDRQQWAYDLAYSQWSPEELESGAAWEHLSR